MLTGLLTLPALQARAQELEIYRPGDGGASRSELPQRANFPQPEPEPAPQVNTNVLPEPDVNLLDPAPTTEAQPEPAAPPVTEAAVQPSAPAAPGTDVAVPVPDAKPRPLRKRVRTPAVDPAPIGEIPVVGVEIGGDEAAVAAEPNWDDNDLDRK